MRPVSLTNRRAQILDTCLQTDLQSFERIELEPEWFDVEQPSVYTWYDLLHDAENCCAMDEVGPQFSIHSDTH